MHEHQQYPQHVDGDGPPPPQALSLSLERLTIESLALPWHKLEEIHEAIHEKRRMVEQHTAVAMDHLRAVAVLNADIFALEKEFSAVMSTVVAERARSQDKLKALVRQWELTQRADESARASAATQLHNSALQAAKNDIKKLRKALEDKQSVLDDVQQQRDDMHHLLKEHNLDAAGPLLESIQSRRIEKQREEVLQGHDVSLRAPGRSSRDLSKVRSQASSAGPNANPAQTRGANTLTTSSSFTRDRHENQAKLERSLAADTSLGGGVTQDVSLGSAVADSTAEIVRLQGELAASRRESMLRKQEADALRSIREDARGRPGASGPALHRALSSSGGSVAASDAVGPYAPATRSVASSMLLHGGPSYHAMQQSRGLLRGGGAQHQQGSSVDTSWADHPVTLGLELGTRRQQAGLAGVHVVSIVEGSPAWEAGIQANDVIVAWAGRVVNRLDDVHAIIRFLSAGPPLASLDIRYLRPGPNSSEVGADVLQVPSDEDIHVAVIDLNGRLDGPLHSRRGSFHSY